MNLKNSRRVPFDRLTKTTFFTTFAVLAGTILCIVLFLGVQGLLRERETYDRTMRVEAETICRRISDNLSDIAQSGSLIFSARWYKHFRMAGDIYADEFTILRRADISEDILARVTGLEYITDILIIVPSKDTVIDRYGWFSVKDYTSYFPSLVHIDGLNVTPASNLYGVLAIEDTYQRRDSAVIVMLIDCAAFSRYVERLFSENADTVRISLDGQVLYQRGDLVSSYAFYNPYPCITAEIGFRPYSLASERIWGIGALSLLGLLLAAALSVLFTRVGILPLQRILTRVKTNTQPHDLRAAYVNLEAVLETYDTQVIQTQRELSATRGELSTALEELSVTRAQMLLLREETAHAFERELLVDLLTDEAGASTTEQSPGNDTARFADAAYASCFPGFTEGLPCILSLSSNPLPRGQAVYLCALKISRETCTVRWYKESPMDPPIEDELRSELLYGPEQLQPAYRTLTQQRERKLLSDARQVGIRQVGDLLRAYVDAHFTEPELSVEALSSIFGMDASLISKRFQISAGVSYSTYVQRLRITRATELLKSDMHLTDIGAICGYPNYLTFKRAFVRECGVGPTAWRQQHA